MTTPDTPLASQTVSVVIPWGKRAGDIERCVESALEQTLAPLEVLLVCNGAITIAVADARLPSALRERVTLLDGSACTNANQARNLAVERASGDWIAFIDSDDWWDDTHLALSLRRLLDAPGTELCYGAASALKRGRRYVIEAQHYAEFGTPENYLLSYRSAVTPSYVCSKRLVSEHPWDPTLRRHQEYEWFVRVCRVARVVALSEVTVNIDWSHPVRHRYFADYLRVVSEWHTRVEKRFMMRHLLRLTAHSLRAMDPAFVPLLRHTLFVVLFSRGLRR